MRPCLYSVVLLMLLLSFTGCEKEDLTDHNKMFFLAHKEVQMPVWVKGNVASKVIILFIQGGPGLPALPMEQYFDRRPYLAQVTKPGKLLWGELDGNVPYEVGVEISSLLTGSPHELVAFENSWHMPFITENDKFYAEVKEFVEKWK